MMVRACVKYEDVSPAVWLSCRGGSKGTSQSLKTGTKLHNVSYVGAGKRVQQRVSGVT